MKIRPLILLITITVLLASCSAEARMQSEIGKQVDEYATEHNIDPNATRPAQPTYTVRPTYTVVPTLTARPTLTPNIVYMTPTIEGPLPTEVRETLPIMGQNVRCGEDFLINVYQFEEHYGFGSPYDSDNGVFKVVRITITNLKHETIPGISSNAFELSAEDKNGSRDTFSPDYSTSSFMNEGRERQAIGKTPWEDDTMYVPLVALRSLIVFDVPLKLTNFNFTFEPSQESDCSVTIPIR